MTTRPTHPTSFLSRVPTHSLSQSRPVWRCREAIYSESRSDVAGRENINNGEPRLAWHSGDAFYSESVYGDTMSRRCGRAFTLLRAHARDQRCHLHAERRSPT